MPEQHPQPEAARATAANRQELLDWFAADPNNDSVWQTAYDWVAQESEKPDTGGILASGQELMQLAEVVRHIPQAERYALMANRASSGKRWFDILKTFSSEQLSATMTDAIISLADTTNRVDGFDRALEIGTGTGKTLAVAEANAQQVIGLDRNADLLKVAQEVASRGTSLVRGEVSALPFDDASFDLVTSMGVSGALDGQTTTAFYSELARVLTADGFYVEGSYFPDDQGNMGAEMDAITASSKAMLADMIVDSVSGKLTVSDYLDEDEELDILKRCGLEKVAYDVLSDDGVTHNLITIIYKAAQ